MAPRPREHRVLADTLVDCTLSRSQLRIYEDILVDYMFLESAEKYIVKNCFKKYYNNF